jgi:hypothetical protein
MASAGMMVTKMPAKRIPTSWIGAHENWFASRTQGDVAAHDAPSIVRRTMLRTTLPVVSCTPRIMISLPRHTPDPTTAASTPVRKMRLKAPSMRTGSSGPAPFDRTQSSSRRQ